MGPVIEMIGGRFEFQHGVFFQRQPDDTVELHAVCLQNLNAKLHGSRRRHALVHPRTHLRIVHVVFVYLKARLHSRLIVDE